MRFIHSVTAMTVTHSKSGENIQAPSYKMGLMGWHPGPGNSVGQQQRMPSEYSHGLLPPTAVTVMTAVPLTYSPTQGLCLPECPLLVSQQAMQMWGRGVLGPLLGLVVQQQLQDRKDPEAGTEPGAQGTTNPPKSLQHHLWAEHWAQLYSM